MFTTSRYASSETRSLASGMAAESGERYVARGKKSVAALAELARRFGEPRVSIIEERDGKPALVAPLLVDELGRWAWAEERLLNSTERNRQVII